MKRNHTKYNCLAAMFLAIGMVLPLLTMQIKEIGDSLLPMHIPVMLCGLICGPWHGLAVGFIMPIFRSVIFSMPPFYPNSVWMAFELAAYGLVIGLLYKKAKNKGTVYIYLSLISAMLCGRVVWGIAKLVLLGAAGKVFTFAAFITGGFIDAIPGIVLQLVLIPAVMSMINRERR